MGDLAHTLVLERLDELSQQLRDRDSHPLFIISSVNYDNYLARLQYNQKKQKLGERKDPDTISGEQARKTSSGRAESRTESGVSQKNAEGEECEGKQLWPPRPADRGNQRGEIDVMLLHTQCGVMLIEVSDDVFWSLL